MPTIFISSPLKSVVFLGKVEFMHIILLVLTWSFSRIFNDFGSKFEVIDATGEEPLTGMVAAITNVSQSQQ